MNNEYSSPLTHVTVGADSFYLYSRIASVTLRLALSQPRKCLSLKRAVTYSFLSTFYHDSFNFHKSTIIIEKEVLLVNVNYTCFCKFSRIWRRTTLAIASVGTATIKPTTPPISIPIMSANIISAGCSCNDFPTIIGDKMFPSIC